MSKDKGEDKKKDKQSDHFDDIVKYVKAIDAKDDKEANRLANKLWKDSGERQ